MDLDLNLSSWSFPIDIRVPTVEIEGSMIGTAVGHPHSQHAFYSHDDLNADFRNPL